MSIKSLLIKNSFFNLLGYFYLLVVSFISVSIFLKSFGRDVFGVYLFLASFVPMASVFDFGVSIAVIRELSLPNATKETKIKVWRTSLAIFIAEALLLMAVFSGLLLYLTVHMPLLQIVNQDIILPSIFVLTFTIFINHLNNLMLSVPQANQRFDIFNSKTFIVGTANTLLSALLSTYTHNILHLFILQLIFNLFTFIYISLYVKNVFGIKNLVPEYNREQAKSLLSYGFKNFIGTLASQMESQVSKFFLGFLSSAQSITAFSIPQNIVSKAAGVVSQFAQAFFPLSASLLEKDRIQKLKKLFFGLQFLIFGAGLLSLVVTNYFGIPFLTWWLKDAVVVDLAYPVLEVMCWYFVLVSLTPLPTALVQSLGKPQVSSFFAVLSITCEIIGMAYFIPKYASLGAAYSFFFGAIVSIPPFLIYSVYLLNQKINEYQ